MDDNTMETGGAGTGLGNTDTVNQPENQETGAERVFTQEEVNQMIARRAEKMMRQKIGDIDLDEYQELKTAKQKAEEADMIRKQKFEELLKKQKETADTEINSLRDKLTKIQVDGALVDAASKHGAVSPADVAALMRNTVQLGNDGTPVVLDESGQPRYDPNTAEPMTVEAAVREFLEKKPFFRLPGQPGTGSSNEAPKTPQKATKVGDLDMKNPEHRKIYAEMMDPRRTRKFYGS